MRVYACKPAPSSDDLGLVNSAGYLKAQIIRLSAQGKTAVEIWETMSEFLNSPFDVEKVAEYDAERIAMAKTLKGNELEAYLNGVAVAHNQYLMNRRLRRVVHG